MAATVYGYHTPDMGEMLEAYRQTRQARDSLAITTASLADAHSDEDTEFLTNLQITDARHLECCREKEQWIKYRLTH